MSLVTPATPTIRTKAEVAINADLTAPSESWDWTELGEYADGDRIRRRLLKQTIEIGSGTTGDVDTSLVGDPTDVGLLLGNGDHELTPLNPSSSIYPGLKRGTPLRLSLQAGLPHLVVRGVAGSRARTPHAAALNVTDLAFALELLSPVQMPPTGFSYKLAGKHVAAGDQRSWQVFLFHDGRVFWRWSANGIATSDKGSVLGLSCPEAGPYTIGGEFDVDNGASGNTFVWYTKRGTVEDLRADLAGSQFGDPDVDPGTTSIFNSTAPLDVGDVEGNTTTSFLPYPGRVNRLQVRDGDLTTGTVVADLDCTALSAGATGTTDSAGRVWAFTDAQITDWRPRACTRIIRAEPRWGRIDETNPLMPTEAYVEVQSEGILERLASKDSPVLSPLTRAVTSPKNASLVVACWPHEDNREATRLAQVIAGAAPMTIRGDFTPGGDTDYPATLQQLTISSGDTAYRSAPIPQIPQVVGVRWEITQFLRIDDPATDPLGTQIMAVDTNGRVATWRVNINDTQATITGIDIDSGGVVLDTVTSDPTWFGQEIQVVLELTDDGANVDWRLVVLPTETGVVHNVTGTFTGDTGVPRMFRNNCVSPGIALGPLIVTSGADLGWLAPADSAFLGEPAPQRAYRLCHENGIPIAVHGPYGNAWDQAILQGATAMGHQRARKILDLLTECVEADNAVLTEQRGALGVVYRAGSTLMNQPVRLSLSRADRLVDEPFRPVADDQRFVNDVTVTRTDGSSVHIEDPRILDGEEERYDRAYEVNARSDLHLPAHAGWRYHLGTWTGLRYPEIRAAPSRKATVVEDMLGFAVGDRFTIPDPPPGHPPDPVDQIAYGIVDEFETFTWKAALNGRPAKPWDTAIVDDATFGVVDTDGSELASSFAAGTGTSMSVATTLGDLWTTDAADLPLQVEIDGIALEVTNITGASSPQTFTVTQATLNGAARTLPAGAKVRLRRGAYVAP